MHPRIHMAPVMRKTPAAPYNPAGVLMRQSQPGHMFTYVLQNFQD
jgi:hypothetical protein